MKKLLIGLLLIGVVIVGYMALHEKKDVGDYTAEAVDLTKWKKQSPQLFNNAGYAKLEESPPIESNVSESMAELIGPITNPFGIRDDILEYIIKNVPNDNESAMKAAIKMMQYNQQIYFGNPSESEVMLLASKNILAGHCLVGYLNKSSGKDIINDVKSMSNIERAMFNTKERTDHMWKIDRKYFSWKAMGSGLNGYEENQACLRGEL